MLNTFQARDDNDAYEMTITGIRRANATGADQVRGSVGHFNGIDPPRVWQAGVVPAQIRPRTDTPCVALFTWITLSRRSRGF